MTNANRALRNLQRDAARDLLARMPAIEARAAEMVALAERTKAPQVAEPWVKLRDAFRAMRPSAETVLRGSGDASDEPGRE